MEIIYPESPRYKNAIEMVNDDLSFYPFAIANCKTEIDVQEAIKFADDNNKKIKVRGARHSYTGASIGNQDTVVIDISKLNTIYIRKDGSASIGSGCQLYYDIYKFLWEANKTSIPAGSCPSVGIGGLATGGGFSFSGRKYGLTCDSILSLKIILANGKLVTASNTENKDLFWACCGAGGGNFGVITEFTFKTFVMEDVQIFNIKWNWGNFVKVGNSWFNFLLNTPNDITPFLKIDINKNNTKPTLNSFGQSFGSIINLNKSIDRFLCDVEPSSVRTIKKNGIESIKYWAGLKDDEKKDNNIEDTFLIHNAYSQSNSRISFYADSVMIKNKITDNQYLRIEKIAEEYNGNGFIMFDGHANGISSKIDKKTSAYAYRDALASVQIYAYWENIKDRNLSISFVDSIARVFRENNSGAYVNYSNKNNKNWFLDYYANNGSKLIEVKKEYDPNNKFQFPQSIPLISKQL